MLNKFASRKFLVTLGALATALGNSNLSTVQLVVLGVVSSVYVIAEAALDHKVTAQVAADVERGLREFKELEGRLTTKSEP